MSAMTDIVERLKYATVRGANETNDKAKFRRNRAISDAADEITRLRTALSESEQQVQDAKRIATNAEHYGYMHGVQAAADIVAELANAQKQAWDDHVASGVKTNATSFHTIFSELASRIRALIPSEPISRDSWAFAHGDYVCKKSGSWWAGRVVGTYATEQTPRGYAVQLDKPFGPVQIYPESALERFIPSEPHNAEGRE